MAIYLDVFSLLSHLSIGFPQELHGPVKTVRCIHEFTQTMAKLKLLIDKSLDSTETLLTSTNFYQILKNTTMTIFTQVLSWPDLKQLERQFVIITQKQYLIWYQQWRRDLTTPKSLLFSNIWCHYWMFQLGQQMQNILGKIAFSRNSKIF